jgi:predicted dehydrogenase
VTPDGAAVIGCGLIGARRAEALEACGVPVRVVHDTDGRAAHALHERLGARPRIAPSLDDVLASADIEVAIVATVHDSLAPIAVALVERGLHVLVEKPAGRTLHDVQPLADAARRHGTVVHVGYNHRFHPALRAAKDLVAGGAHGPVMHIRGRYGHGGRVGYESEWRADRARSGGGELVDQGSHLIDLTRHLCGDVTLAFAELRTSFWEMAVEDNAFLALRADSGAFAWLHASWSEWKNMFALEIAMRHAKVDVIGLGGSYGPERLVVAEMAPELGPPRITTTEWPPGDDSWRLEVRDLLDSIDGRPSHGATVDDAVAVHRIIDEAYRQ